MIISTLSIRPVRVCVFAVGLAFTSLAFTSNGYAQNIPGNDEDDLLITVESGDTFSGIVSRELNSLDAWGEVARYNKLASPDSLRPGDVIVIPGELLRRRNFARVVFVKGNSTRSGGADDASESLAKGDKIYPGDMIKTDTDGFVSLSFSGGTSVNIQPDSTMRINVLECIDKEQACEINLESEKGQLGLDVNNEGFSQPTIFTIDTPYASAAVRGTKFDFDVNDGNVLGVTEGLVQISLNGISNDIKIGKGVLGGQGRSINDLYDLLVKPTLRLNKEINRVSDEDVISWDTVEGASKYLLAFANSDDVTQVVADAVSTDNVNKPDLAIGDYQVIARAVDPNGLRGFVAQEAFSRVDIDNEVTAPELDIVMTETELQVSADASAGAVEVKLGNQLKTIDSYDHVIGVSTYQISAGETIKVPVDMSKQWYLQGRKVVNKSTVSPYGLTYFFKKQGG